MSRLAGLWVLLGLSASVDLSRAGMGIGGMGDGNTNFPTVTPTAAPTSTAPSTRPTPAPSTLPSHTPTGVPSALPTQSPTAAPLTPSRSTASTTELSGFGFTPSPCWRVPRQ